MFALLNSADSTKLDNTLNLASHHRSSHKLNHKRIKKMSERAKEDELDTHISSDILAEAAKEIEATEDDDFDITDDGGELGHFQLKTGHQTAQEGDDDIIPSLP